jgi:TPR repeat protein
MAYVLLFLALFAGISFFRWITSPASPAEEATPRPSLTPAAEPTPSVLIRARPDYSIQESEDVREFRHRALAGDKDAQRLFGEACFLGKEIPQDYLAAMYWFLKASAQGCAEAQFFIGVMYDEGYGISKNVSVAMQWFVRSAENGCELAQVKVSHNQITAGHRTAPKKPARNSDSGYTLGESQLNDDGTPIQSDEVREIRFQALGGDMESQRMLGEAYFTGKGIMKDNFYAMLWFSKAADQGSPDAQFFVGAIHDGGHGVPKNSLLAMQWYVKAAESGSLAAQQILAHKMA